MHHPALVTCMCVHYCFSFDSQVFLNCKKDGISTLESINQTINQESQVSVVTCLQLVRIEEERK